MQTVDQIVDKFWKETWPKLTVCILVQSKTQSFKCIHVVYIDGFFVLSFEKIHTHQLSVMSKDVFTVQAMKKCVLGGEYQRMSLVTIFMYRIELYSPGFQCGYNHVSTYRLI